MYNINGDHTISERKELHILHILLHMWNLSNNISICVNKCACEHNM